MDLRAREVGGVGRLGLGLWMRVLIAGEEEEEEVVVYGFLLLLCWYRRRLEVKTMSMMMLRRNHYVGVLVGGLSKHVAVFVTPQAED